MSTVSPATTQQIPGWGADKNREDRPGVPKEKKIEGLAAPARGVALTRQPSGQKPPVSVSRRLTPVYSTAVPPRGLSGAVRRGAYRVPEYRTRRWILLMLADRIDVLEHNLPRAPRLLGGAGLFAAGLFAARALRARRTIPVLAG